MIVVVTIDGRRGEHLVRVHRLKSTMAGSVIQAACGGDVGKRFMLLDSDDRRVKQTVSCVEAACFPTGVIED